MIKAPILQERPLESQEPPLANAPSLESWLSPNPASQVNRREFAHFRVRLHPHSFPPSPVQHSWGKKPRSFSQRLRARRRQQQQQDPPAPQHPATREQLLLLQPQVRDGLTKSPTQPCWFCYLKLSKQTIRHNTPVTTGEEGKVVQKFQRAY